MTQDKTGQQKEGWSNLYGRYLTEAELEEIKYNVSGFFSVLQELADEEDTKLNEGKVKSQNGQANNH